MGVSTPPLRFVAAEVLLTKGTCIDCGRPMRRGDVVFGRETKPQSPTVHFVCADCFGREMRARSERVLNGL